MYRKLAPGPWFHSIGVAEYYERYQSEILSPLDPHQVAAELRDLAADLVPVLLCFEQAHKPGDWCHRAMAAEWLAESLGQPVPEFGHELLTQDRHPLLPAQALAAELF